ncbi:recombination-associated protein RdgC [Wielerella bovis]|uniref:recombination-associated protein RdgC n=1 Tax=Wielerella bovis TaxID=2917790 RepID=UPI0020189912|nr:recombination-associated protein RdgC [Wielerella bovis]ULJ66210.1 recombination-associated protein RdgC [Wielerella bovis]
MFPKQLTPFILTEKLPSADVLNQKLATMPFVPVTGLDWFSEGFTPPAAFSPDLVFAADKTVSVCLKRETKQIPSSALKEILRERVADIETTQNRKVGRKEKQEIKEQIIDELLPKALSASIYSHAVFNSQFAFVYESSPKKAENVISKMREALGGLACKTIQTKTPPKTAMTNWVLRGEVGIDLQLDNYCLLKGVGEVAPTIKIQNKDLNSDEVQQHIKNGLEVKELGLIWREKIAFVLTENFTLKRIQFLDMLQQETEQHGDDAASLQFAQQLISSANITQLLNELILLCGDLNQDEF